MICDITFGRPKLCKTLPTSCTSSLTAAQQSFQPTDSTQQTFLRELKEKLPSAVIHSSFEVLSTPKETTRIIRKLPGPLTSLKNLAKYGSISKAELRLACKGAFNTIKCEADFLEESTRQQTQSTTWHKHRIGRITASVFYEVARASLTRPPASLVKKIVNYSSLNSEKVPSLHWGLTHEDIARQEYLKAFSHYHIDLQCGLHINPEFPHLGGSPDIILNCECCGKGTLEIVSIQIQRSTSTQCR